MSELSSIGRFRRESATYAAARDELARAEIALKNQREAVAEMRRALPGDTQIEDYVFEEGPSDLSDTGPAREIRLSEFFEDPEKTLVLQHFMFGKAQQNPCPMCSLWTDGYNGIAHHIRRRVNFAVLAAADISAWRDFARDRGWTTLRLISAADSSIKSDFGFEGPNGEQHPGVSVFTKSKDGTVRHFYSGAAPMSPSEYRGMDLLTPFWSLLDLTPEGRGDFFPGLNYD